MAPPEARGRKALWLGAACALGVAVAAAVLVSGRPPEGPVAVDWDGTRCARCGMLVSEPGFAAQLHLEDGSVQHFDDPGCLLLQREELAASEVHAAWLHHVAEDRWLPLESSAFVPVPHSPMGYGLGAVEAGSAPDALRPAAALARLPDGVPGGSVQQAGDAP